MFSSKPNREKKGFILYFQSYSQRKIEKKHEKKISSSTPGMGDGERPRSAAKLKFAAHATQPQRAGNSAGNFFSHCFTVNGTPRFSVFRRDASCKAVFFAADLRCGTFRIGKPHPSPMPVLKKINFFCVAEVRGRTFSTE